MNNQPRVIYEQKGPLGFIRLNRAHKLNAIDGAMVTALHAAMDEAEADDRVRVIVLLGEGRAFSAGFDLEEDYQPTAGQEPGLRGEIQRDFDVIMRFWDSTKPTLAAVHGACLGGAFEIALACDLCISTDDCRLGEPEVRFGSGVVAMLLPFVCGPRIASEIILCGDDRVAPERALAHGIVNKVVSKDELEQAAIAMALRIARNDPNAVRHARLAIKQGYDSAGIREALEAGLEHCIAVEQNPSAEAKAFAQLVRSEGTAAAAAWLDKQLKTKDLDPPESKRNDP